MTPTDLAAALERLSLTKEQACRLLGVSPRAWRSWHEERRGPHPSTVRLLWLMELDPNNIEALKIFAENEENADHRSRDLARPADRGIGARSSGTRD